MTNNSRSFALLFARIILGLIFFMAGIFKVFQMGPLEHARRLFVEPYAGTILPTPALWAVGTIIPVIELVAGALLIVGYQTQRALIFLGFILIIVTFGHLIKEPLYEFHTHVIPRLILLLFIFILPRENDRFSLDYLLVQRKRK